MTKSNTILLKNEKVTFEMALEGSAFLKFEFQDQKLNPLDWSLPIERLPDTNIGSFPFRGQFLCLGTWGMPTDGEKKAGLKFYGEVNTEVWDIVQTQTKETQQVITHCLEPNQQLEVLRTVTLSETAPVLEVTETVTNQLPIGRPYNMLQHATFGGQFINQKTIISSNAGKGFYQNGDYRRATYEDIEATSYDWPMAQLPDVEVDLRPSKQIEKTFNSSHIFPDSTTTAWATIANREDGLLIGYIWDKKDYPWLNIWHQFEEGKVKGRALEFATCGMWQSFEYMMTTDSRFFGQNSFEFIDAGETKSKSYKMFLLKIDKSFEGVDDIQFNDTEIDISFTKSGQETKESIKY
ncbi:hypothetical protein N7E81_07995 [Reichenbachiella carrageenanivorans]|uniref:Galactose mutarotase n=1 Tax=Reichenbachiella carrageenanivorans TaxID=2979869 RepID=A0ABY6D568_9BACT|nr:hypothetical protein [Reichenbachiella carrageenanivorans]UXX81039.1 hypothetical protein N7E81_07995 [Reichenbachiella carrageenanivorans]